MKYRARVDFRTVGDKTKTHLLLPPFVVSVQLALAGSNTSSAFLGVPFNTAQAVFNPLIHYFLKAETRDSFVIVVIDTRLSYHSGPSKSYYLVYRVNYGLKPR